jgi:AcrR family transcriptional regulator
MFDLDENRNPANNTYRSVGILPAVYEVKPWGFRPDGRMAVTSSASKSESSPVALDLARVAAHLFATRGYEATSVREIVEKAGVAKPTLYYYYGSKEGLARSLVFLPLEGLVEQLRQIVTTVSDPLECLEQCLEAHFAFCREDPDRSRFLYALIFGPPGSEAALDLGCCKGELTKWIEAAIRRLAEAGVIHRDRVDACITMCRGMIVISTLDYLYGDKPLGRDLARGLVSDLLRGFAEPSSSLDVE